LTWYQANVSTLVNSGGCGRKVHSTLQLRNGTFDRDIYELKKYDPLKDKNLSALHREARGSDTRLSGIISHDIMQWVLSGSIEQQSARINDVNECLQQVSKQEYSHFIAQDFIKDLMPSSIHDARIQKVVEKTAGLIRGWKRFLDKFEIENIVSEKPLVQKIETHSGIDVFLLARADAIVETVNGYIIVEFKTGSCTHIDDWKEQLLMYNALFVKKVYKLVIIHPNMNLAIEPIEYMNFEQLFYSSDEVPGQQCNSCIHKTESSCESYTNWEQSNVIHLMY